MQTSELGAAELPALLALCVRALPLDRFTSGVLRTRWLEEPEHDPALQLGVWEGDRLVGALLAGVRTGEAGAAAAVRLLAVDQDFRRRGVASRLLVDVEERVRARGHRALSVGNSAPVYFWPGVDLRYTPALCLLERRGYARTGEAVNMRVDLAVRRWGTEGEEARLRAGGFAVRRLAAADREAFAAWLLREWGATWQAEAIRALGNEPVSAWVATEGGVIRSFAAYGVTAFEHGFGPTGTEEAYRGKGLGSVLFRRCMRDLAETGHATAEVIWVGPVAYYARVADAWINRVFAQYEKRL